MNSFKRVFGNLAKGAMRRLAPYDPTKVNETERYKAAGWMTEQDRDARHSLKDLGEIAPNAKIRALHQLSGKTQVRINPHTKEREFLLHRGAGRIESALVNRDKAHNALTSWTPKKSLATSFAHDYQDINEPDFLAREGQRLGVEPTEHSHLMSAWIPESMIHHVPRMIEPREANDESYSNEQEVIVKPHQLKNLEMVPSPSYPQTETDVNTMINLRGQNPAGYKPHQGEHPVVSKWKARMRARLGKSELQKSPYGPSGMGLYNEADNARRKMSRTTEVAQIGPNKAVQATKPSSKQQAASIAAEARRKSKANPVKVYTQAEIAKLFRGGFKRPAMTKSELEKGVNQRLFPFKPTDVSSEQRSHLGVWSHQGKLEAYDDPEEGRNAAREYREMVAPMTGNARQRMLNRLAAKTKVKRHPQTGENMYLMFRGMDDDEREGSVKEHHVESPHGNTSWTPDYQIARGFATDYTNAGHEPVAAWVPERHILAMPKMVGKQSNPQFDMDTGNEMETFDRKGPSTYSRENEVVVAHDHQSPRATVAEVHAAINKAPSNVDQAINMRDKGVAKLPRTKGYHRKLLNRLRQR